MIFLKIVGTQFSFQQGKIESQKISCVNILERWLNTPTPLIVGQRNVLRPLSGVCQCIYRFLVRLIPLLLAFIFV
jgi:hypothetical protein